VKRPTKAPARITDRAGKERWPLLVKLERDVLFETPQERLRELRDLLISHGGDFVILPVREQDLDRILERGEPFKAAKRLVRGARSQCHANVARLWEKGALDAVATGYALTWDPDGLGVWRQHSWGVRGKSAVETTAPRSLYFGVAMRGKEADQFASEQL
jgi:hypothetical protein